jgi:hypothetical protein
MNMLRTYQGYFKEGRFISPDQVSIPDNVTVHITIVGGNMPQIKTKAQLQNEALRQFSSAMREIINLSYELIDN